MEIKTSELKTYLTEAIEDIKQLMTFRSVRGTPSPNAPYGTSVSQALTYVLTLAEKMGFRAHYGPNHTYGYADYGSGSKIFGIVCHLDVVPPGDLSKWTKSPWEPIIENKELYGRGSLDDKGPTIINMYALKYLKDHGFMPHECTIRFIFGLTEETDWASIGEYKKHEQDVDAGYVPDGEWPVVYAEKGIMDLDIIGPSDPQAKILTPSGAYNMVPDQAVLTLTEDEGTFAKNLQALNKDFVKQSDGSYLIKGVAKHGSIPEEGVNAVLEGLTALKQNYPCDNQLYAYVLKHFANLTYRMEALFEEMHDESGLVSVNIGMLHQEGDQQRLCLNLRVPVTYSKADVLACFDKSLQAFPALRYELKDWEPPKHVDKDGPLVQGMMDVYKKVTQDYQAVPKAIGGGTYSRAFKKIVAFGACHDVDLMHGVNERIKISELTAMLEIYIKAIALLVN